MSGIFVYVNEFVRADVSVVVCYEDFVIGDLVLKF